MKNILISIVCGAVVLLAAGAFIFSPRTPSSQSQPTSRTTISTSTMEITSAAFEDNGSIPSKYSCDGEGVSPPLSFGDIPASAKSLALIVDDPDVPKQLKPDGVFDHWVLFNIPPAVAGIPEGSSVGTMGNNGAGKKGYTGPCPPPQYEPKEHRYVFTLYALDAMLPLQAGASKAEVLNAALNHVVGEAQLIGRYQRAQ